MHPFRPFARCAATFALAMPALIQPLAAQTPAELPRAAPQAVGLQPEKLDAIATRIRADIENKQLAGAVVLVARQGRVAYLQSFGVQDPGTGRPMPEDAIFRIYSMTKPVTVAAALALVDDGKLSLDDRVDKYLPEFATARIAGSGAAATRTMTVRDLMRHTAGLDYEYVSPQSERSRLLRQARSTTPADPSLGEFTQMLAQAPLAAEPGTTWAYSYGIDVLGRVIEVASGMRLGRFMAERLFVPLDMRDTAFVIADARQDRLAEPLADDRVMPEGVMFDQRVARRADFGGMGLMSTARDYARFLQMLLNGGVLDGKRVLRAETAAEIGRDQIAGIARGPAYSPGPSYTFGLGVGVRTAGRDAQPAGDTGDFAWGGGGGTYFWADPKNQMYAVLMMQSVRVRTPYRAWLRQTVYGALQP